MNPTVDESSSQKKKIKLEMQEAAVLDADFVMQSIFILEVKLLLLALSRYSKCNSIQIRQINGDALINFHLKSSKYIKQIDLQNHSQFICHFKYTSKDENLQSFSLIPSVLGSYIGFMHLNYFYFLYQLADQQQNINDFIIVTNRTIIDTAQLSTHKINVNTSKVPDLVSEFSLDLALKNVKKHTFKFQTNKKKFNDSRLSQYFEETNEHELKTFLEKLIILEYPFHNENQLKDYIRNIKQMGECFNFIDISLANDIAKQLLEYDFSTVNSVKNFFTKIKNIIDKTFINNRFSDCVQALMWYGCDSNNSEALELSGKLLPYNLNASEELMKSTKFQELFIRLFSQRSFSLIEILLLLLKDEDRKKVLLNDVSEIVGCPIKFVSSGAVDTDKQRLVITSLLIDELREAKFYPSQLNEIAIGSLKHKHYKTFKYFMDRYSGNYVDLFKECMKHKILDVLQYLLQNHMDVIRVDGNSELHLACQERASFEVILILANEENINARNNLGQTPLFVANINGLTDRPTLEYLIDQGAEAKYRF